MDAQRAGCPGVLGHRGPQHFAVDAATAYTPEAKVWFRARRWWSVLASVRVPGRHTIHRLDRDGWRDIGAVLGCEEQPRADVLVAPRVTYIVSRSTTTEPPTVSRFAFRGRSYVLDDGFPVQVRGFGSMPATIARDLRGTLWMATTCNGSVLASWSTDDARTWSEPIELPMQAATDLWDNDVCGLVSLEDASGAAVGVLWSNQSEERFYFALHRDGDPPDRWEHEVAFAGHAAADDHVNLKVYDGRVYAAVKTGQTDPGDGLIRLLVRAPSGGWSVHTVAMVHERNTRPIVLLQPAGGLIHVIMTLGEGGEAEAIVRKTAQMEDPRFPRHAIPIIRGAAGQVINDATSTKQNLAPEAGMVILASDETHYWYSHLGRAPQASRQASS